jgi:transposase InsO family protein
VSELYKVEQGRTISELCTLFGRSKQSYYKRIDQTYKKAVNEDIILQMVQKERKLMPRIGGRKLHYLINLQLDEQKQIGRDKLFSILEKHNLLIRRKRTKIRTTDSHHWLHKYPNLIKDFTATKANQLWVSDITYIKTKEGVVYLFLITDSYSKKIMGWKLADNLKSENAIKALEMAIKQLPTAQINLIHHSDRGIQYCSSEYVKLLNKHSIKISMTQDGNPLDNAVAERINGILKTEWLNAASLKSKHSAIFYLHKIIGIYNNNRPHLSLNMQTPNQIHSYAGSVVPKRLWKNYYRKPKIINEYEFKI